MSLEMCNAAQNLEIVRCSELQESSKLRRFTGRGCQLLDIPDYGFGEKRRSCNRMVELRVSRAVESIADFRRRLFRLARTRPSGESRASWSSPRARRSQSARHARDEVRRAPWPRAAPRARG